MSGNKIFDRQTVLKIFLGSILGALAVYFAFKEVSLTQLYTLIIGTNLFLLISGLLIVLLNVIVVTYRWWLMLLSNWKFSEFNALLGGVYLGQMFNILLPARLGELARLLFVSERTKTTKSALLGSLVLEKVVDVIAFGIALLLLITAMSFPTWVTEPSQMLIYLAVICVIAIIFLVLWGRKFLVWIKPLMEWLPGNLGERIVGILERALTGFDSMRSWKRQLSIWSLTVFSLILSTLTNYLILLAVDIQVPFVAALFVLIVLRVGNAPPSAPGKLGVFHYLAVLALSVFSVNKDLALAYGVLLYVVALMPKVLIGAGVIILSKWRLPTFSLDSLPGRDQ
jgi:uncharacterized protein (TIRG00374 family)